MTARNVLIADDDKLILSSFRYALVQRGYNVLVAADGIQALKQLEDARVDIVFLDILMPQKEGLETLLELRRRFPSTPVYVMSGGGTRSKHDFLAVAQKFGATGVLRKPITPADLIKIIEMLPREGAAASEQKTA